jgi:negative regulator of sigma E activity
MDIEKELAAALRAQDPGPDFTAAVNAQLKRPVAKMVRPIMRWRLPVTLAASVLLAVVGANLVQRELEQQRLLAASEQLNMALAIASAQLNYVQQKINLNDQLEDGI